MIKKGWSFNNGVFYEVHGKLFGNKKAAKSYLKWSLRNK